MFKKKNKVLGIFLALFFFVFLLSFSTIVLAGDPFGADLIKDDIVLGDEDPRTMASRVINIALSVLSILAVAIVIFAGFLWMTAAGNEEKVDKAKKVLKAGIIGLVIILSAWGITSFVLAQLGDATGIGQEDKNGDPHITPPGTGEPGSACGEIQNNICINSIDEHCNEGLVCVECVCVPEEEGPFSELGDPCYDGGACLEAENVCNPNHGLICDSEQDCTCQGSPVITGFSPVGGFCEDDINAPCSDDSDCSGTDSCNLSSPNIAAGNLITILGYNFGDYEEGSSQINFIEKVGGINTEKMGPEEIAGGGNPYPWGMEFDLEFGEASKVEFKKADFRANNNFSANFQIRKFQEGDDENRPSTWLLVDETEISFSSGDNPEKEIGMEINEADGDGTYWIGMTNVLSDGQLHRTTSDEPYPYSDSNNIIKFIRASQYNSNNTSNRWYYMFDLEIDFHMPVDNSVQGLNPEEVNSDCDNSWSNTQIIVAMPEDAPFSLGAQVEAEVVTSAGLSYRSGDSLELIKVNNINRPGLCKIAPGQGEMNDEISYHGINLQGGKAYFGGISGLHPNIFSNNLYGFSRVPNISSGKTSTLVEKEISGIGVKSNFLNFKKLPEPPSGPSISFFDPEEGAPGQYVSIYGSGFGNMQGNSSVFFGGEEADYDFPEACLHSVWNNNQIIVKVPEIDDGGYNITLEMAGFTAVTASYNIFNVDSSLELNPSLCKMSPTLGPHNSPVSFWGEYFGDQARSVFSINKTSSSTDVVLEDGADKITVSVPSGSVTGPVAVEREEDGAQGNSLNFTIGVCSDDSGCPEGSISHCCLSGTHYEGACVFNEDDCFSDVPEFSAFQWSFTTEMDFSENGNGNGDNGNGETYYSCASYSYCPTGDSCPNTPGFCSIYNPLEEDLIKTGDCQHNCSAFAFCGEGGEDCYYDEDLDKCLREDYVCNTSKKVYFNTGDEIVDSSPHNNHGTNHGAVSVMGKIGQAYSFYKTQGDSSYISIPNSEHLKISENNPALSIAMWIKAEDWTFDSNSSSGEVAELLSNNVYRVYHRGNWAGNRMYFLIRTPGHQGGNSAWAQWSGVRSSTEIQEGEWYHLAAVLDHPGMKIYINGEKESELSNVLSGHDISSDYWDQLLLGRYNGLMEDIRIYNRALNDNEINQIKNNINITNGLVGRWNFNEGEKEAVCKEYTISGQKKYYYTVSGLNTCPSGWSFSNISGSCVDVSVFSDPENESTCSLCPGSFACQGVEHPEYEGFCVSPRLCSGNSICYDDDKCKEMDKAACECCCDIDKNHDDGNEACCSPLKCDDSCGESRGDDNHNSFGYCSGCYIGSDVPTSVRDMACNCEHTSGQYCEVNGYPDGVCLDCTGLGESTCREHDSACCWDYNQGVCRGGAGNSEVWGEDPDNLGYCPYYSCDPNNPTACLSEEPIKDGDHPSISVCESACAGNCDAYTSKESCQGASNCCWDYFSGACLGGDQIELEDIVDPCDGMTTINYEGHHYKVKAIGGQCWFRENLRYDDGCGGVTWSNWSDVGWCGYYNNNSNNEGYGLLYQWSAAMAGSTEEGAQGLCPDGWRIPSDDDFKVLEMYLGMSEEEASNTGERGINEGDKLKRISAAWCYGEDDCGDSGFDALPAGVRFNFGSFSFLGSRTDFWSSSVYEGDTWARFLRSTESSVFRYKSDGSNAFSIRCIKESPGTGSYNPEDIGFCKYYACNNPPNCNVTLLSSGSYSSQSACDSICQSYPVGHGDSCGINQSCDISICAPFDCLLEDESIGYHYPECGICCCNPGAESDQCSSINESLHCQADKGNCTGEHRGICCGCEADEECSVDGQDSTTLGCGHDACCWPRPEIESVLPEDQNNSVCTNATIEINFDRRMDTGSFGNNILVLREVEGVCPSGTQDIAKGGYNDKENFFAKIKKFFTGTFDRVARLFGKTAIATPLSSMSYCITPGSIEHYHAANGKTTAYFTPNNLLAANSKYFVVVKGDENLDSQQGVKSAKGVGMNGALEANIKFNNISFENGYKWSFETLDVNEGLCEIDYIHVSPSSYLFQTNKNDLNENDYDPNHPSFDSVRDRDKVYRASAYSWDHQLLHPTNDYGWTWKWEIMNQLVLKELNEEVIGWGNNINSMLIKVKEGVTSGKSEIKATAEITNGTIEFEGKALAYVLLCRNPWPAIDENSDPIWKPWKDDDPFGQFNYEFYYCRDHGSPATSDDLPAFLSNLAIIKGPSNIKVCSNNPSLHCASHDQCPAGGICLGQFLKETYFFKERTPSFVENVSVTDTGTGESLDIYWESDSTTVDVDHYKVYYSFPNYSNMQYIVENADNCVINNDYYNCSITLDGLNNYQEYLIMITAVSEALAETGFSDPVFATPTESSLGTKPSELSATVLPNKKVELKWEEPEALVQQYKVYRGPSSTVYTTSFLTASDNTSIIIDLTGAPAYQYYFAVSAINPNWSIMESDKSDEVGIDLLEHGGIIFYKDDNLTLVSKTNDQSGNYNWGPEAFLVEGLSDEYLGDGLSNTESIATSIQGSTAATICFNLSLNGYSDWYLPNMAELEKMHENREAVGGFVPNGKYWSSGYNTADEAKIKTFNFQGNVFLENKNSNNLIRCIRKGN
jgi:uncharacterized protein (TIGR02145 family)